LSLGEKTYLMHKKTKQNHFNALCERFISKSPGIGGLFGQHGIGIISKLGLVSYEHSQACTINPNSESFVFFRKHFKNIANQLTSKIDIERFLTTVVTKYGTSMVVAENMTCKAFHL